MSSEAAAQDALLTSEESDALFQAMNEGRLGGSAEPASLASPDGPLRRVLKDAEKTAPKIAEAVKESVLRLLQMGCECSVKSVQVGSVDTSAPAIRWALRRGDITVGAIAVGALVAQQVLDRRLGTSEVLLGADRANKLARSVSALDRRMLEPLTRAIADAVAGSGLIDGPLTIAHPVAQPKDQPALVLTLSVKLGIVESDVVVTLEGSAVVKAPPADAEKKKHDRQRIAGRLGDVEVEVVAVLGKVPGTVRELLALKLGSLLRLDSGAERPIPVCVQGVPVMRGTPRVHEGQLAIEITEHRGSVRKADKS